MADKNFIFSMKPYDIDALSGQMAWMLEKRVELASRKKLPGLWKLTDKLNATRTPEAEAKRRKERQKAWGGLFLVMGIFLFVPGIMNPQELVVPLVAGFLTIILGVWYLKKDERKNASFEKKAIKLLEGLNASMEGQKLRLVCSDTKVTFSGVGDSKKVLYENMECTLETEDLFGLVQENQLVLLQKQELLLGEASEFARLLEEKTELYGMTGQRNP